MLGVKTAPPIPEAARRSISSRASAKVSASSQTGPMRTRPTEPCPRGGNALLAGAVDDDAPEQALASDHLDGLAGGSEIGHAQLDGDEDCVGGEGDGDGWRVLHPRIHRDDDLAPALRGTATRLAGKAVDELRRLREIVSIGLHQTHG